MAAPTVAGTTTTDSAGKTTSHTVNLPASIVSGNLLVIFFAVRGGGSVTWPAGYTEIAEISNSNVTLSIAYRQADGGEGSTITVTTGDSDRSASTAYRITGHIAPATQAPELSTGATGTSTTPDPDSLTPTGGSKEYLWLAGFGTRAATTHTAIPTSYSNQLSAGTADDATCGSAERRELLLCILWRQQGLIQRDR